MYEERNLGLTTIEVEQRWREGKVNSLPPATGKTIGDIVRTNVFTRINAILGVLFVAVLTTGSWINSAFGLLIIANSAIGIIQEIRAKHTLESLSLVGSARPLVRRDGRVDALPQTEIVLDDIIELRSGNQIVVDGDVCESEYLMVDESMLTGESDPVPKYPGDTVFSGSFVVAGIGAYRVNAVGADSYAAQITTQAGKYSLRKSQLQQALDTILRYVACVLIPVAIATIWLQWQESNHTWQSMILAIAGALVPLVPEGLVLLTSTAFALGVIHLGKHGVLVQELPAIEGLARVNVLCTDKTGTLTENTLEYIKFVSADIQAKADTEEQLTALRCFAASEPDPNATIDALNYAFDGDGEQWDVEARQPFSSIHKWSGVHFAGHGTWVLGAPEVVADGASAEYRHCAAKLIAQAAELNSQGLRVLMFARANDNLIITHERAGGNRDVPKTPALHELEPVGIVVFGQKIRATVADTIAYFGKQNVKIKIISGDSAQAVTAITEQVGVPVRKALEACELGDIELASETLTADVFGRVRPDQKQTMVRALQDSGYTVAMTGDGVNDVLALKEADLGIAMGTGSSAARAVSKIVLLNNSFATLPHVVSEGRRVIGNIERVANLFLTKTIYSAVIAVLVIIVAVPFPFQPIHVTITGWFTIGIPAFVLSLPQNNTRARDGFVRRVVIFSLPAGAIVGASSFFTYLWASDWVVPSEHVQESSAALLALIIPSVWVLAVVARPWNGWKLALFLLPVAGYTLIFTLPFTQGLFLLDASNGTMMCRASVVGLVAAGLIEALWWLMRKQRENC